MDGPLKFAPIYQTRIWGGRSLETQFGRELPTPDQPYGESWEISAREEADSVVTSPGPFLGKTLTALWREHREPIFGATAPAGERFPLLCKILDARDKLSIQVHPPAKAIPVVGGEPKTEMWYIAHADPGAALYVGVVAGVTRDSFEAALRAGELETCIHRIPAKTGDHIFIPSGRLHAIGAGLVIYEIQQNSDTTFRVYDWGRVGMNGVPRDLHIEESLQCIDFDDVEPSLDQADGAVVASCEHFVVERHEGEVSVADGDCAIFTAIGDVTCGEQSFAPGDFFLVPATGATRTVRGECLLTRFPKSSTWESSLQTAATR
jgi:mannose-6-phosphate isomerase